MVQEGPGEGFVLQLPGEGGYVPLVGREHFGSIRLAEIRNQGLARTHDESVLGLQQRADKKVEYFFRCRASKKET